MEYRCVCGHKLVKQDMGLGHYYYNCIEPEGGCGKFYGILGERFWWSVPAIDELTGEIVYEYKTTAEGSFRITKPKEEAVG